MELTGKITGISTNRITNATELTLSINEDARLTEGYDELKDVELLDIVIKKHRNRRSKDANAYFHVLVEKLADKLRISKPRCKNLMIGEYGQTLYLDEEKTRPAIIKTNIPVDEMLESEAVHCIPCKFDEENGQDIVFYKIKRGSSTYDTLEMSILIDGVVSECRQQGIETMTPDEIKEMMAAYEQYHAG